MEMGSKLAHTWRLALLPGAMVVMARLVVALVAMVAVVVGDVAGGGRRVRISA